MTYFTCDICNSQFNSLDDYIVHLQEHKADVDRLEKERQEMVAKRNSELTIIKNEAQALQKRIMDFHKNFSGIEIDFKFSVNNPTIIKPKSSKTSNLEDILLNAIENTSEVKDDTFKSFMDRVDNNIDKSKFSEKESKEYNSLKSMVEFLDKLF